MPDTIHSDAYRSLLVLLRRLRDEAGLTQTELAARLGQPQSWVSKMETGERRLDVEELRQVCEALDTKLLTVVQTWIGLIPDPSPRHTRRRRARPV